MAKGTNLTYASAAVLQAIASGHAHGFEIMDASGLPSGTVYPALRRLERARYVKSAWEPSKDAERRRRPRRRYYEITASGIKALEPALERFRMLAPLPKAASPGPEHAG